jgi:signal transduction histidine kinase
MKLHNPFIPRSPYKEMSSARRKRIMLGILNACLIFSLPLLLMVGSLLFIDSTPSVVIVLFLCFGLIPASLLLRRLTLTGRSEQAGAILIFYLLIVIAVNALLIGGFFPMIVPGFLLLILLSGMLLNPLASYGIAAMASLLYILALSLRSSGVVGTNAIPPIFTTGIVSVIIVMSFSFVLILNQLATQDLRKALDEATYDLVQANRQLEQTSEMKTQFTARTSHELRTPLSAIIVFTDLALRDAYGPLNDKLQNALEHVLNSARHLKGVISDILDISKIEAGELEIIEAPFKVMALIESLQSSCEVMAEEKGLEYQIHLDPDLPERVIGDEGRLAQVLMNLSGNAVKFTEEGKVDVGIHLTGDEHWGFSVSDMGPGIPEDQFESIFKAYRQLDSSFQKGKNEGTGLGLAITKHIVEQMGGRIHMESRLGKGTTFEVFLPLKVAEDEVLQPDPIV